MGLTTVMYQNMAIEAQQNDEGGYLNTYVNTEDVWRLLFGELNDGDINPYTDRGLEEPEDITQKVRDMVHEELLNGIATEYLQVDSVEDAPVECLKVAMVLLGEKFVTTSKTVMENQRHMDIFVTKKTLQSILQEFMDCKESQFQHFQRMMYSK